MAASTNNNYSNNTNNSNNSNNSNKTSSQHNILPPRPTPPCPRPSIMSGYRSIHRETLGPFPIWNVKCTSTLVRRRGGGTATTTTTANRWRMWLACGDGIVRGYLVEEKTLKRTTTTTAPDEGQDNILDASACRCVWTHALLGALSQQLEDKDHPSEQHSEQQKEQEKDQPEQEQEKDQQTDTPEQRPRRRVATTTAAPPPATIGCTQVETGRNYVGEDDNAGDLLVVSLDLMGTVRIWVLPEDADNIDDNAGDNIGHGNGKTNLTPLAVRAEHEFRIKDATGTCLRLLPPRWALSGGGIGGDDVVVVAVPCLDGTVALVATGVVTPTAPSQGEGGNRTATTPAGTVLDRWTKAGSAIALSAAWQPPGSGNKGYSSESGSRRTLAVGRQDGLVELVTTSNSNSNSSGDRGRARGGREYHSHSHSQRLVQHETPVRAVEFTPDGGLLITASDEGMLCVWDTSRLVAATGAAAAVVLVHHSVRANSSWILSVAALPDSRRFVSTGADGRLHVWGAGHNGMDQPLHSFADSDADAKADANNATLWTVHCDVNGGGGGGTTTTMTTTSTLPRLVAGTEGGGLHIYTFDA